MKNMSVIPAKAGIHLFGLLLLGFGLWFSFYRWEISENQNLKRKGELLAELLFVQNQFFWERHLYPAMDVAAVEKMNEVDRAYLIDEEGVVLAPQSHFGKPFSGERINAADIKIEKEVVLEKSGQKGKIFLTLHPYYFPYRYSWIFLFVFCALLTAASLYIHIISPQPYISADADRQSVKSWIEFLQKLTGQRIFIFDEKGHLFYSTQSLAATHIIDLFPSASQAQHVLREMRQMRNEKNICAMLTDPEKSFLVHLLDEKNNSIFVLGLPLES